MNYNDLESIFSTAVSNITGPPDYGTGSDAQFNTGEPRSPLVWLFTPTVNQAYAGSGNSDFFKEGFNIKLRAVVSQNLADSPTTDKQCFTAAKIILDQVIKQIRDTEVLEIENYNLNPVLKIGDGIWTGWDATFVLVNYQDGDCCSLFDELIIPEPEDRCSYFRELCDVYEPATVATDYVPIYDEEQAKYIVQLAPWLKSAVTTTHGELLALKTVGGLTPQRWYRFPFQNKHAIQNTSPVVYNNGDYFGTSTQEYLVVQALTNNSFKVQAHSESYPLDVIHYDITGTLQTEVALNPNNQGAIIRRIDPAKQIDFYYDWRTWVVRDWSGDFGMLYGDPINHVLVSPSVTGIGRVDNPVAAAATYTLAAQSTSAYDATPRINAGSMVSLLLTSSGAQSVLPFGLYSTTPTMSASIGSGATLSCALASTGGVKTVTPSGGANYSENDTITFSGSSTTITRQPSAKLILTNGVPTGVEILDTGAGLSGPVTATINTSTGSGCTLTVVLGYYIASVSGSGGTGYTDQTVITFTGDGYGAAASILVNPYGYRDRLTIDGYTNAFAVSVGKVYNSTTGILTFNNCCFRATLSNQTLRNVDILFGQNSRYVNALNRVEIKQSINTIYISPFSSTSTTFDVYCDKFNNNLVLNTITSAKLQGFSNSTAYKPATNAIAESLRSIGTRGASTQDLIFRRGQYAANSQGPGMNIDGSRLTFEGECFWLVVEMAQSAANASVYVKNCRHKITRDKSALTANYNIAPTETNINMRVVHSGKSQNSRELTSSYIGRIQMMTTPGASVVIRTMTADFSSNSQVVKEFYGQDGVTYEFEHNNATDGFINPGNANLLLTSASHFIAFRYNFSTLRWVYDRGCTV